MPLSNATKTSRKYLIKPLWLAVQLSILAPAVWAQNQATNSTKVMQQALPLATQQQFNKSVTPAASADFYLHTNQAWINQTQIPADKVSWGGFMMVHEKTQQQLKTLVQKLSQKNPPIYTVEGKVNAIYQSFMNEKQIEKLGLTPLQEDFADIQSIKDKNQLATIFAQFNKMGLSTPVGMGIGQDFKDSNKLTFFIGQDGISLPDRDYYLKDTPEFNKIRQAYVAHIAQMLSLAAQAQNKAVTGNKAQATSALSQQNFNAQAQAIFNLEKSIAQIQWATEDVRDPVKAYNPVAIADLNTVMPQFNWSSFLNTAQVNGQISQVIVEQPSYFKAFNELIQETPLEVWQSYLSWQVIHGYAPYLPKAFVNQNFAFYGTTLYGVPKMRPRWQRALRLVNSQMGEGLGQAYVKQYFPAQNKARLQSMVVNLKQAYKQRINALDWMSDATKAQALKKLETMHTKIGYPDQWKNYDALQVSNNRLIDNVKASAQFSYQDDLNKLPKPADKNEWHMPPQTVNAYYSAQNNEIVFPAAILQPPFFDMQAEDAQNYAAIGAVIGHEISHAFDDNGSQFDENGNMRVWWSKQDREKYEQKTQAMVEQYNKYSPLKGYTINGKLTLGENIADNAGLLAAYDAYVLSQQKDPTEPFTDAINAVNSPNKAYGGQSAAQRFYKAYAQSWRSKEREGYLLSNLKSDPHSPDQFRVNGSLTNDDRFYQAFDIPTGAPMYTAPEKRVKIW